VRESAEFDEQCKQYISYELRLEAITGQRQNILQTKESAHQKVVALMKHKRDNCECTVEAVKQDIQREKVPAAVIRLLPPCSDESNALEKRHSNDLAQILCRFESAFIEQVAAVKDSFKKPEV
jgi:hypothetical protein